MKNSRGSLYGTMLTLVILPMAIITIAVSCLCGNYFMYLIQREVETELSNICSITESAFDKEYPGDYIIIGEEQKTILKGESVLNGAVAIPDSIKKDAGVDVTLFYYDTRVITTIVDGDGQRIIGTPANAAVMRDVYEGHQPAFYKNVNINGKKYFAYYKPLFNSDGTVPGMLSAVKPIDEVSELKFQKLWPMWLGILLLMLIEGAICMRWASNTIKDLAVIQKFLTVMSEGKFSRELSPVITGRNDEIGKLGEAIVKVQAAIRDLIEKDMLTGLNNRRFGYAKLAETTGNARKNGVPFSVVMCDIDHFKKFNDTYGHDVGDIVLKEVAKLLRTHMAGQGFAIRWGGEEFLLVFTHSTMVEAVPRVEAILNAIRALRITAGEQELQLTMSFGVADGVAGGDIDNYVKLADERLYYAKEHGRNQVVSMIPWWDEPEEKNNNDIDAPGVNPTLYGRQNPVMNQMTPADVAAMMNMALRSGMNIYPGDIMARPGSIPVTDVNFAGTKLPVNEGETIGSTGADADTAQNEDKPKPARKRGRPRKVRPPEEDTADPSKTKPITDNLITGKEGAQGDGVE